MKNVFLMMIASCFFATQGFGQSSEKVDNPNAPEMTFEVIVHDFGTLQLNALAECEFTFTNTGKEPLIIQNCPSTCGCTVPSCPKDKPIKPGEKGTIKVKYNSTNTPLPFNKQFTVISNAKNSPVTVTIKGEVAPKTDTAAK